MAHKKIGDIKCRSKRTEFASALQIKLQNFMLV